MTDQNNERLSSDLKFLNDTSLYLADFPEGENLYQYAADKFHEITENCFVLITSLKKQEMRVEPMAYSGLPLAVKYFLKVVGFDPLKADYPYYKNIDKLLTGKLSLIKDELSSLSGGKVSKSNTEKTFRFLGIKSMQSIGFVRHGKLFGNALFFMTKEVSDSKKEIVETFATQVSIAIQRKQIEEELVKSRHFLESIIEDQNELIVRWKKEGIITYANASYCKYFEKDRDYFIGKSFFDLIPDGQKERVKEKIQSLSKETPVLTDVHKAIKPNGDLAWHEWTDRAIFEGDNIIEYQSVGRDISEQKVIEKKLEGQNKLNKIRAEIWQNAVKTDLTSFDHLLDEVLGIIGKNLDIHRVSYLSKDQNSNVYRISSQWQNHNYPDTTGTEIIAGLLDIITDREVTEYPKDYHRVAKHYPDKNPAIGDIEKILDELQVKSVLIIPQGDQTNPDGFFMLSDCERERSWSHLEKRVLKELISLTNIIAGQIKVHKKLKESRETAHALINATNDFVVLIDPEGNILNANQSLADFYGLPVKDMRNQSIFEFRGKTISEKRAKKLKEIKESRAVINYNEFVGDKVFMTSLYPILDEEGAVSRIAVYVRDITRENEIKNELIEAINKAEESDRLKSAFLANLSHEIRTPMNAILGFSELLDDEDLSKEERSRFIEMINANGNNLMSLIDDIIDLAKIEAGQLNLEEEQFNLNQLLMELHATFLELREKRKKSHISFRLDFEKHMLWILADDRRLRQVLYNILENAVKYTEKGEIILGYKLVQDNIHIHVRDTGPGIAKSDHEKIFQRFRRVESSSGKTHGGSGLGLAISKNIASLLKGDILLESELGKGSTFTVVVPYKPADTKNTISNAEKSANQNDELAGKKIMIAEDVESNFVLLKLILEKRKVEIIWAKNGQEALNLLENVKADLLLLDMKMPVMDGFETLKVLRKKDNMLPVIALTAHALDGDKDKVLKAGCNGYLSKPVNSKLLIQEVKKHLA